MKKYLLLIACVFLSFFYLANKNVNYKQNDLYNVLKTIDYGPLDKEKLLYINSPSAYTYIGDVCLIFICPDA